MPIAIHCYSQCLLHDTVPSTMEWQKIFHILQCPQQKNESNNDMTASLRVIHSGMTESRSHNAYSVISNKVTSLSHNASFSRNAVCSLIEWKYGVARLITYDVAFL